MATPPTFRPTAPRPAGAAGGGAGGPARPRPGVVLALVCAVGVVAVWRAFVLTRAGRLIDHAALEGAQFGRNQLWDAAEQVLDVISVPFIAAVLLAATLLALLRRRLALAAQVALVMGGANLTTQVLKRWVLGRPDVGNDDYLLPTLPSGHTTAAASVAVALVLVVPRRLRPTAAVAGAFYTGATGVSTMVAGWHRPSDVVAAVLVVLGWAGVASAVGAVYDPAGRGFGTSGRPGAGHAVAVARALLVASAAAWAGAVLALVDTARRGGEGVGRELVVSYAGGALGIAGASLACFGVLLLVRRATEPAALRGPADPLPHGAGA